MRLSLPSHRAGSPWQQKHSLLNWLRTDWRALWAPRELMSQVRIERRSGSGLLALNTLVAAAFLVDPWVGAMVGDPARDARLRGGLEGIAIVGGMWLAEVAVAAAVLWILTGVEYAGIRFFAARRGWRLTREGAWQVCCHASVGWVLAGILPMLLLAVLQAALRLFHAGPGDWGNVPGMRGVTWSGVVYGGGLLAAMGVGLVVFEFIVHTGVRKCRYAAAAGEAATERIIASTR